MENISSFRMEWNFELNLDVNDGNPTDYNTKDHNVTAIIIIKTRSTLMTHMGTSMIGVPEIITNSNFSSLVTFVFCTSPY